VAATLEVHQVNVGGNGQITGGEFAGVAKSESSRVHQFVLGGDAFASSGLVSNSHACSVSGVVGRDSHDGLVIELVEDGEGGITVASRFEDSVDVALLHGESYVLAGASAFLDAVTSGETEVKVFVGKNGVQADLWCSGHGGVDVQVEVVFADVLLELAWYETSVWAESGSECGFSEAGGNSGFGHFDVQAVGGVPSLFNIKTSSLEVGFYATFDGGRGDVLVSFDNQVHAIVLVFQFELNFTKVVVFVEEVITSFSKIIEFWWSHFEGIKEGVNLFLSSFGILNFL